MASENGKIGLDQLWLGYAKEEHERVTVVP